MKVTKHNFTIPCVSIDNFIPSVPLLRAASEGFDDIFFVACSRLLISFELNAAPRKVLFRNVFFVYTE